MASNKIWIIIGLVFVACLTGCDTPLITGIDPQLGATRDLVTIEGNSFKPALKIPTVTFAGIKAEVTSWQETAITAKVPPGVPLGPVDLVVRVNGKASLPVSFLSSRERLKGLPILPTYVVNDKSTLTYYGIEGMAMGDFNEDGYGDLAIATGTSSQGVLLMPADGMAGFGSYFFVPIGRDTWDIAVTDFNRDGHDDVAAVTRKDIVILLGDGQGGLGEATFYEFTTTEIAGDLVLGDFNEDGCIDLAVLLSTDIQLAVLFGDGAGGFSAPSKFTVGSRPSDIVAQDFNRDGHLDLAVTNSGAYIGQDDTVSVLLGEGQGGFGPQNQYPVGDTPEYLTAGDLNRDGNIDLVVSNIDSYNVSLLFGDGLGGFSPTQTIDTGGGAGASAIADFNGDGLNDIVIFATSSDFAVLFGDGMGQFPLRLDYPAARARGFITGDFNDDSRTDLYIWNGLSGSISLLLGDGGGGFGLPYFYRRGTTNMTVITGDLDNDGLDDFVTSNIEYPRSVGAYVSDGFGGFSNTANIEDTNASALAAADFDSDGYLDLAFPHYSDKNISIHFGDGDGSFIPGPVYTDYEAPRGITTGDFNNDGEMDIATANGRKSVGLYISDGSGAFTHPELLYLPDPRWGPYFMISQDLNHDDHDDLAMVTNGYPGAIWVFWGDGTGRFPSITEYPSFGDLLRKLAAGDFDGDGNVDLAVMNSGALAVYWGDGAGGMSEPEIIFELGTFYGVTLGDINNDGSLDIFLSGSYDGIIILFGDGQGGFSPMIEYLTPGNSRSASTGDFNGDGITDMAVATSAFPGSGVYIFFGDGHGGFVDLCDDWPTPYGFLPFEPSQDAPTDPGREAERPSVLRPDVKRK